MDDSNDASKRERLNSAKYGGVFRATCGEEPDPKVVQHAASLLNRDPSQVDKSGYQCELIAAAIHPTSNQLAYVESREKKRRWTSLIDISIKIHLRNASGTSSSVDIKSYNPFFGCDVGLFEWIDDTAVLIYTEKHETYISVFGTNWPPRFVPIEDRWIIENGMLGYIGYKQNVVQRVSVPGLEPFAAISVSDAEQSGMLPPDP